MNKIVSGDKSEIKKDIEHFYGIDFVKNYQKFKNGEVCLKGEYHVIYVDENKFMIYDQIKNILTREGDKSLVQLFFEHDDGYGDVNVSHEIQKVKNEIHSGKEWNGYRFRDGKYYNISQSNYFTGWFTEEEVSDDEITIQIIKSIDFS